MNEENDEIIPVTSDPPKINKETFNVQKIFWQGFVIGMVLSFSLSAILDYIIEKGTTLRDIITSWRYISLDIWIAIFILFILFLFLMQYKISNKSKEI